MTMVRMGARRAGFALAVFATACMFSATLTGAASSDAATPLSATEAPTADRVIDKTDETFVFVEGVNFLSQRGGGEVAETISKAAPIPADEQPAVGETVEVQYANATVVHTAVAAACTVSSTAGKPYKNVGYSWGQVKHSRSSGCGSATVQGVLSWNWLGQYYGKDVNTRTVSAGESWSVTGRWQCNTTSSTTWKNELNLGAMTVASGGTATLACGD